MATEPTHVIDCTKCGDELTQKKRPLCRGCVDDACEAVEIDCAICGKRRASHCDDCAQSDLGYVVREYAGRRKALGFMTAEMVAAFEEFAEDLEANVA